MKEEMNDMTGRKKAYRRTDWIFAVADALAKTEKIMGRRLSAQEREILHDGFVDGYSFGTGTNYLMPTDCRKGPVSLKAAITDMEAEAAAVKPKIDKTGRVWKNKLSQQEINEKMAYIRSFYLRRHPKKPDDAAIEGKKPRMTGTIDAAGTCGECGKHPTLIIRKSKKGHAPLSFCGYCKRLSKGYPDALYEQPVPYKYERQI